MSDSDSENSDQSENSDVSDSSDRCDCGLNSCEECFNRYFGLGSESENESESVATPCPECTEEQVCEDCLENARCAADGKGSAPHIWVSEDDSSNEDPPMPLSRSPHDGPHIWVSEDESSNEGSPVSLPCPPHVFHHHFHWAMNSIPHGDVAPPLAGGPVPERSIAPDQHPGSAPPPLPQADGIGKEQWSLD